MVVLIGNVIDAIAVNDRGGDRPGHVVMVPVGDEHGFPEGLASGGIQAERPLFAVGLRRGEGAAAGFKDGALAFADVGAPEFLGAFSGPLPEQPSRRIDVVAIIGQEADIAAVGRPRGGRRGQQDEHAQEAAEDRFQSWRIHGLALALGYSRGWGGSSRAPASARSALMTFSSSALNLPSSFFQPMKLAASRPLIWAFFPR